MAAARELARVLLTAGVLIAVQDRSPTTGQLRRNSGTRSRLPGNVQAFYVLTDAHEGVRRLEADLRREVSGSTQPRGGSDANTRAALDAIVNLSAAADPDSARYAARLLMRWTVAGLRLPGIDEATRWRPIRGANGSAPPQCPYCATFSLRLAEGAYVVACFNPDCEGRDADDRRPVARLDVARVPPHDPVLVWGDGTVQGA
jgi:hypothetical protein